MSEEERLKFLEDLQTDPVLSGEYELHKLIDHTLEQHDEVRFRSKLKEILSHRHEHSPDHGGSGKAQPPEIPLVYHGSCSGSPAGFLFLPSVVPSLPANSIVSILPHFHRTC